MKKRLLSFFAAIVALSLAFPFSSWAPPPPPPPRVDITSPTVLTWVINAGSTAPASVTISFSGSDWSGITGATVEVVGVGSAPATEFNSSTCTGSGIVSVPISTADGEYNVKVTLSNNKTDTKLNNMVGVDKTPPTFVNAPATKADGTGYTAGTWTNQDVTVKFIFNDPTGSGIGTPADDVTVSTEGVTPSVSGTATDKAGNSASGSFGPIWIDKTKPEVSITGPSEVFQGASATATVTASDARSGLAVDPSGTLPLDTSTVGDKSITVSATDNAGNTNSATLNYTVADPPPADQTPPIVTGVISPTPNGAGWNNSEVTITWSAEDPESGIASGPTPASQVVSTEGAGQTFTATATNGAGLDGTGSVTLNIDKTKPVVTATADPSANGAGWNNTDVTVTFSATDTDGSGVATIDPAVTISTEGAGQVISGSATDVAGNTASASVTLNIDKTKPVVTATAAPSANGAGWNNTDVTVTFSATDTDGSGVATIDPPVTVTTEGAGQVITGSATDVAGNTASASVTLNIDKTKPVVTINPLVGPILLNQVVNATWNATDIGGSGVVPPASGTIPLVTSSVGSKTLFAPVVEDVAGNKSDVATASYSVIYNFSGLLSPYSATKESKAGSSIPLKWQYTDCNGMVVNSSAANPTVNIVGVSPVLSPGKSGSQYDLLTNTWQLNWQTPKGATGTYNVSVTSGLTGQTNGPSPILLR